MGRTRWQLIRLGLRPGGHEGAHGEGVGLMELIGVFSF